MECLQNKINNASGVLQPTIYQAILNLYLRGNRILTARMVSIECSNINALIPWNTRIPAICNSMRSTTNCGAIIISVDKDFNGFTIKFNEDATKDLILNSENSEVVDSKKLSNSEIIKTEYNFSGNNGNNGNSENKIDFKNLKGKKKLLIIPCSAKKMAGGDAFINDYFPSYKSLNSDRNKQSKLYDTLLVQEPTYFNKKRNKIPVNNTYFINCKSPTNKRLYMPALNRYIGAFYKNIPLYISKIEESDLHVLIISGFYGVLKYNDSIIDYHLEINKNNTWTSTNVIRESIEEYIAVNSIPNENVFYSLSENYRRALNPINQSWKDLWVKYSRSANTTYSANYILNSFLPKL